MRGCGEEGLVGDGEGGGGAAGGEGAGFCGGWGGEGQVGEVVGCFFYVVAAEGEGEGGHCGGFVGCVVVVGLVDVRKVINLIPA